MTSVATRVAILPGVDSHFVSAHRQDTWIGESYWMRGRVVSYNYKSINIYALLANPYDRGYAAKEGNLETLKNDLCDMES